MAEWALISFVPDTLVSYFFGSTIALSVAVIVFFLIGMLSVGLEFKFASLFTLPLVAALVVGGFFGVNAWVLNIGLMIGGLIYGTAIVKLMS